MKIKGRPNTHWCFESENTGTVFRNSFPRSAGFGFGFGVGSSSENRYQHPTRKSDSDRKKFSPLLRTGFKTPAKEPRPWNICFAPDFCLFKQGFLIPGSAAETNFFFYLSSLRLYYLASQVLSSFQAEEKNNMCWDWTQVFLLCKRSL